MPDKPRAAKPTKPKDPPAKGAPRKAPGGKDTKPPVKGKPAAKPPRRAMPASKTKGRIPDDKASRQLRHARRKKAERNGEGQEWAGQLTGPHNASAVASQRRASLLKSLIEPDTPALIQAMREIALNQCVSAVQVDKKGAPLPIDVHPSIRLEAADRLLNRAYGKPKEHLQIDDPESDSVDRDEVLTLLNNILESVGAPKLDGTAAEPPADDA